jgi:hypothetical protein
VADKPPPEVQLRSRLMLGLSSLPLVYGLFQNIDPGFALELGANAKRSMSDLRIGIG